jgi:nucleoside-diphosphate-sugar epimerase
MNTTKTALVLGASGGIGGEVTRALLARGWQVKALNRAPINAPKMAGVSWIAGDAMQRADVVAAADGVSLIVHAVNPAGYRDWDKLVLPMMENSIAAARASGARILLPGTVYNFGSGTAQPLRENTPQSPSSRKGVIRVRMEALLREAAEQGVRSLVVRSGDFFGPRPGNNWFSQGMVTPGKAPSVINYPGKTGAGHSWAYLPDLAATMVRLVEQEARLGAFEVFNFRGYWDADGTELIAALRRVTGKPDLKVRGMPWLVVGLLGWFMTLPREMYEMRYLWAESFELDNTRLLGFIGGETHTPLDQALRETLEGLGCIKNDAYATA